MTDRWRQVIEHPAAAGARVPGSPDDGPRWPHPRSRDGGADEIPLLGSPGRLWLCGKHAVGPDPEAALAHLQATTIVCLTQRHELAERYPDYVRWLESHRGGLSVWFPIHDLSAPPLALIAPLFDDLVDRLDAGERLIVHCGAGIGRAGTAAVVLTMLHGSSRDDALRHVARHRPMAGPEAGSQIALIDTVADEMATGSGALRRPAAGRS